MPSVLLSYSWDSDDHKRWVRDLAERLATDGVDVVVDQWDLVPGDHLTEFMERGIREAAYVLIVCTPRYKRKSESREGGVGYEGDIMTAEVLTQRNHRKFIPILRTGDTRDSVPSWLSGKYYIDLRPTADFDDQYGDLLSTISGHSSSRSKRASSVRSPSPEIKSEFERVRILGVIVDEVTEPRNDNTRGSALYRVPFRLSRTPPAGWAEAFMHTWNSPPEWSSSHRPGIARVVGDTVVLDGTTIDEVQKHHRDTLVVVLGRTNELYEQHLIQQRQQMEREAAFRREHQARVRDAAKDIRFD